jgi:hypothetical protein
MYFICIPTGKSMHYNFSAAAPQEAAAAKLSSFLWKTEAFFE